MDQKQMTVCIVMSNVDKRVSVSKRIIYIPKTIICRGSARVEISVKDTKEVTGRRGIVLVRRN